MREVEGDLARGARGRAAAVARLRERNDLDALAAENLVAYLEEERETAGALPTDRRIVVERFRDELGDWRIVVLTPFGGRVHAPWSVALEARLAERLGAAVRTIWSDDGIAIRLPEGELETDPAAVEALLFPEPDEVEDLVVGGGRELGAVRLALPRERGPGAPPAAPPTGHPDAALAAAPAGRRPAGRREPLRQLPDPRRDVSRVPGRRVRPARPARGARPAWQRREIAVHSVETVRASPFASSLLFDYVAAYMYDGDAPIAERRAQALTLDRDLLRELLGQEELRELLDPAALADLELALQGLAEDRRVSTEDGVHDLLRRVGDLRIDEVEAGWRRSGVGGPADAPRLAGRARRVASRGGRPDRRRGALDRDRGRGPLPRRPRGPPPRGVPEAFLAPAAGALEGLLARWGRTHGPFLTDEPADPLGPAGAPGRGRAGAAAGGRDAAARRVPARRGRARVVRSGRPALAAPALAGASPPRGRAGRAGRARAVPARLARRRAGRASATGRRSVARPPSSGWRRSSTS